MVRALFLIVFENMRINLKLLTIILAFLSGCSSNYEWERWEYRLTNEIKSDDLRASLIPTRFGARKLSSTGPYRLVLHQQRKCSESYLELEKIEIIRAVKTTTISTWSPKDITVKSYSEECLLTFASEALIDLDFESGENLIILVHFISDKEYHIAQKVKFRFKPEFSKGKTTIPWFTT